MNKAVSLALAAILLLGSLSVHAGTVTVYGTGLSGPGTRDTNWQVVGLPGNWVGAPSASYDAYVYSPGTAVGWYQSQPWDGVQKGFTNTDGHFYWIGPQSANSSIIPFGGGAYNWIVAQDFTVADAGYYTVSFSALSDELLSVYVNGSVSQAPLMTTITGGQLISGGATNGVNFGAPKMINTTALLNAGTNTIYAQVQDSGFSTGLILGNFTLTSVPEPSTYLLFGLGVLGLVIASRRRQA